MHAKGGTNMVAIPGTNRSMREIALTPIQDDVEYSWLPGFQLHIKWIYDTTGGIYPHEIQDSMSSSVIAKNAQQAR